ncbi:MAG: DUF2892 domain-containing protein [Candidatus Nitronauta litoralis]|uniref:DUF2892 domain-containing protein n=1 Tax=Candidatus Nitronauta litoralis TaxID=2705533 RepID=A0A7T0G1W4_9BACT|nr:MAG: DUF2892 domain-containing protein [Candidatus Nitronauta litoralis]
MKNVGTTDRLIRMILGLGLVFGGIASNGSLGCAFVIVGLVVTFSGMTGKCVFYTCQGINTCALPPKAEN